MYKTYEAEAAAHSTRYYQLKSAGVCVECRRADERTARGLTRCAECNAKQTMSKRPHNRMVYAERKSRQQCGMCGKKDAYTMAGRALCAECAVKCAERKRRRYGFNQREAIKPIEMPPIPAIERPSYGLCFFCGNPITDRKRNNGEPARTCERCWQRCNESAKAARESKKKIGGCKNAR